MISVLKILLDRGLGLILNIFYLKTKTKTNKQTKTPLNNELADLSAANLMEPGFG